MHPSFAGCARHTTLLYLASGLCTVFLIIPSVQVVQGSTHFSFLIFFSFFVSWDMPLVNKYIRLTSFIFQANLPQKKKKKESNSTVKAKGYKNLSPVCAWWTFWLFDRTFPVYRYVSISACRLDTSAISVNAYTQVYILLLGCLESICKPR